MKLLEIKKRVVVDRSLTPQQVLDATGLTEQYVSPGALSAMPNGRGKEVEVEFFEVEEALPILEVLVLYSKLGLTPDPYALAAVNRDDVTFIDEHTNSVCWTSSSGPSFLIFMLDGTRRYLQVNNTTPSALDGWFGGVRA